MVNNQAISQRKMKIWQVSREMSPLAEAGGIKDVVAGLSKSLADEKHDVTVVLPMYRFLLDHCVHLPVADFHLEISGWNENIGVYEVFSGDVRVLLLKAECFINKDKVYTYSRREEEQNRFHHYGSGHRDSDRMNLTLQFGALEAAMALGEKPDLYHLHDGHCGFLPALIKENSRYAEYFSGTETLLTIHNGGEVYQQNIRNPDKAASLTGLPKKVLQKIRTVNGYSPLVCAGLYGNLNTVSEGYAREILDGTDRNCGELGIIFSHRNISLPGITNGIDPECHDNCSHTPILINGSLNDFYDKKRQCRTAMLDHIRSLVSTGVVYGEIPHNPEEPLFTMQSRITYQKGIDLLLEFLEDGTEDTGAGFLILGEGDKLLENELSELAEKSGRFCYVRIYDKQLSDRVFAGGDFFLIPSRWEPCGLTDFMAQINGNVPLVNRTGGLIKTVDKVNGFSYTPNDKKKLREKITEAVELYRNEPELLHEIRRNAVNIINEKYTWRKVLDEGYMPLYRKICSI